MIFRLDGKVALVTGAGQGVGAAIAMTLSEHGATVAVNDIHPARAVRTVENIIAAGGSAIAATGDVGDRAAMRALTTHVSESVGPVDILVNNAGIPSTGIALKAFADTDPSEWDSLLRVNIHGVLNCAHSVIPAMLDKQWGRIVTISSDSGRTGEAMMAVYATSKAAGAGLMRSLAQELGPHGITCNTLSLGTIGREATDVENSDQLMRHLRRYPTRRLGKPSDIAAAVLWLVSDAGEWITGQTIPVNGGYATG